MLFRSRASPWYSTILVPPSAATLDPAWCRFRSGAATAAKTCPSPTASPRRSSAASKPNGRFGAAGHQGALRPRLTTVIPQTLEPLFSQLPVAANRSKFVLHTYERTFYTPCLSSRTLPLFLIPTSVRRRESPRSNIPSLQSPSPVSYVCRGSMAPR